MGRAILAVIASYIVIFLVVFCGLTAAFLAMGVERAYQPASYDVSTMWIVVMIVVGLIAALAGGCVCRAIARRPKPVVALAIVVLVLGLGQAAMVMMTPVAAAEARPANVGVMEAMMKSRQPMWTPWANAVIGFVGVLIGGGRLVKAGASNEP